MLHSAIAYSQENINADSLKMIVGNKNTSINDKVYSYNELARYYRNINLDQSLIFIQKSFDLVKSTDNIEAYAKTAWLYSNILCIKGDLNDGIDCLFKSAKAFEEIEDVENLTVCYHSLGETYRAVADFNNSLKYLNKAYKIALKNKYIDEIKGLLNRFSAVYFEMKEYNTSIAYADSSLKIDAKNNSLDFLSNTFNIIGANYRDLGQFDSAKYYLQKSLLFGIRAKDWTFLPGTYNNITSLLIENEMYDSAIFYAHESLKLSRKIGILSYQENAALNICKSYKAMSQFDSALAYHEYYTGIRWEIFNQNRSLEIAEIQAKYEFDKKDKENQKLIFDKKLQQEKIQRQKLYIVIIVIIGFLIILFPLFFFNKRRQLQKSYNLLSGQKNEIETQRNQLTELNKTKEKMLSIIAHDLKNPFHSIQGFSELLMDEANKIGNDELVLYAGHINLSIENLNHLLDNLLKWTQLQRGTLKIIPEEVALRDLTDEAYNLFKSNILEKRIVFKNRVSPEVFAFCDQNTISTVIRNIVSNAVKFTPENGIITVSSDLILSKVQIKVEDNGIGMDKEKIEGIFSLDKKLHRGTHNEKGSGLGMILCKEFIEKNGGEIFIASNLGKGTIVKFHLPLS